MSKRLAGIITMISILLSPLLGGLLGRIIANSNILHMSSRYLDDGLCYVGAIAWIIASVVFFLSSMK